MFSKDTCDIIQLLNSHNVKYMIIGGKAANYHGYIRYTGDIDFFYELTEENCQALYNALKDFWGGEIPGVDNYVDLMIKGQFLQSRTKKLPAEQKM